jgi:predicted O-linked N-acetylglucosamine transferase (SPINDLY family)
MLEQGQDRARTVYRDLQQLVQELRSRVQSLESQAKQRLSPAQHGMIYRLVQAWGEARAAQSSQSVGSAIRQSWREFNARFGISAYTDLPAAQVDTAVQFVQSQYRALTGSDLPAAEQAGLEGLHG